MSDRECENLATDMSNIKRILVVDGSKLFREFLVQHLRSTGFAVLDEAAGLEQAKGLAKRRIYDLILLDLELPDGDGVEFVDWQMRTNPSTRILVLTSHSKKYPVLRLKRSTVMGMLDKQTISSKELLDAVGAVGDWRSYYSKGVEDTFRQLVSEGRSFYKVLSRREEMLIKYFGLGYSNAEISQLTDLTESTVQGYRRNVLCKLNLRNTPDLIIWAFRNGFVRADDLNEPRAAENKQKLS